MGQATLGSGNCCPQLVAIIDGSAPGQEQWSDDLDYWMKRRATQILGFIGEGNQVLDSVNQSDASVKIWALSVTIFGCVTMGLKRLKTWKPAAIGAKSTEVMDDVLQFVAYSMERESKWMEV